MSPGTWHELWLGSGVVILIHSRSWKHWWARFPLVISHLTNCSLLDITVRNSSQQKNVSGRVPWLKSVRHCLVIKKWKKIFSSIFSVIAGEYILQLGKKICWPRSYSATDCNKLYCSRHTENLLKVSFHEGGKFPISDSFFCQQWCKRLTFILWNKQEDAWT